MKNLIASGFSLAMLFASHSLSAQSAVIDPAEHTCSDFRSIVFSDVSTPVKGLFSTTTLVYGSPRACPDNFRPRRTSWCTIDNGRCSAGFTCVVKLNVDND